MSDGQFTPKAAVLWGTVPKEVRPRILATVFCVECHDTVTITKFTGEERNGDLILKGVCAKCGHKVAHVVKRRNTTTQGTKNDKVRHFTHLIPAFISAGTSP